MNYDTPTNRPKRAKKLEINRSQICINDDYKRSWLVAQDYYHIVPFSFTDYHMIYYIYVLILCNIWWNLFLRIFYGLVISLFRNTFLIFFVPKIHVYIFEENNEVRCLIYLMLRDKISGWRRFLNEMLRF